MTDSLPSGAEPRVCLVAITKHGAAQAARLNCGDLDGDGEVGGADISLALLNFGPCTQ
jgi:hypothetical protein